MTGRDRLNPMTKITYRRAASDSSIQDSSGADAVGRDILTLASNPESTEHDAAITTNPAREEYESICRDINSDMAIITANFETESEASTKSINRISGPIQDLCSFIKKTPEIGRSSMSVMLELVSVIFTDIFLSSM